MKTFVVLGMHRSATSLVASGLYDNDVYMGKELSWNHEDTRIKRLNQDILKAAGGKWDDPPPEEEIQRVALSKHFEAEIKEVVDTYKCSMWGWKDPRTTLTIRLWLPVLDNPHFICCYRNPLDVAVSLKKRNKFSLNKGIELAKIYNQRIRTFMDDWLDYESIS